MGVNQWFSSEEQVTLNPCSLPLRCVWPFLGKECKKQTVGMMCTNAATDKSIWSHNTVDVIVSKHCARENVPYTGCMTENTLGNQFTSMFMEIAVTHFVNPI